MTLPTILAIDLGKFKSVACAYPRGGATPAFHTIPSTRGPLAAWLERLRPAVVVRDVLLPAAPPSRARRGKGRAAHALRLAAWCLMRSQGALGASLRRQRGRLGAPKAITATAHQLARVVYGLMRYGMAYVKQTEEAYAQQVRERQEQQLHRRARELGFFVVKAPEAATTAALPPAAT